jgi:hypothetical protein
LVNIKFNIDYKKFNFQTKKDFSFMDMSRKLQHALMVYHRLRLHIFTLHLLKLVQQLILQPQVMEMMHVL